MRKEGIQTRKRKPKQNPGGGGLGSLSSVLGGGPGQGLGHGGDLTSMMMGNSAGGASSLAQGVNNHGVHPSLHNSLMNSSTMGKSHMFGHHHHNPMTHNPHTSGHTGVHGHHQNHQAAAAAAAAAVVAAAVADSHNVKLEVE